MSNPVSPSARRALSAALLAVFLGALDLTVIATILPGMVTDLRINAADVDRYVWIVNSYLVAYIVAIPVVGRLSDLVGRSLAFQGSLALFVIGSLICAAANDLLVMVLGRAVQGAAPPCCRLPWRWSATSFRQAAAPRHSVSWGQSTPLAGSWVRSGER
jgi:MFS family permease